MAITLADLLQKVEERERHNPLRDVGLYREIEGNQNDYIILKLKEKRECIQLGIDNIPKRGDIVAYTDNEFYDLQEPKFKAAFPELSNEKNLMIIDQVDDVALIKNKEEIELKIIRYVVQRRQSSFKRMRNRKFYNVN